MLLGEIDFPRSNIRLCLRPKCPLGRLSNSRPACGIAQATEGAPSNAPAHCCLLLLAHWSILPNATVLEVEQLNPDPSRCTRA